MRRSVATLRSTRQEFSPDGGWSRHHRDSPKDSVDFEQLHVYTYGAEATMGHGHLPVDPVVAPPVMDFLVERHLQVRLAEILATFTVDRTGALVISSVLVDIQARQRRPLDVDELPQPGDSPKLYAIMPPTDD